MAVVGHQAVGAEAHRSAFAGLAEELDEAGAVAVLVAEGAAAVTPVADRVAVAALTRSWVACLGALSGNGATTGGQEKRNGVPTLSPFLPGGTIVRAGGHSNQPH